MNIPAELKYTSDHEWVRVEGDLVTVGITDYAQGELGDVVFVELPDNGAEFDKNESFGTIEAVKAVADLFAPVSGAISEINQALEDAPEIINQDPYGEGWMVKIKISNPAELDEMLDSAAYANHIS